MEEILSSIRRIIADEETEDTKSEEDVQLASVDDDDDDDDDVSFSDELDAIDDDDDDADDVLELTAVVDEGAEIVDLNADTSSLGPLHIADDEFDDDEEEEDDDDLDVTDLEPLEPEANEPEIELTPLEFDDEPEPEPEPVIEPVAAMNVFTSQEDEPAVSTRKMESDALLSTGTASTTTGAFAKLSKAFRPTPVEESVADGSGRTIEQFIEDMARPMLKEWLDENMPAIVERLVQKEIQKIARRAELL
jgi:cell pole-organizing protein PopZ